MTMVEQIRAFEKHLRERREPLSMAEMMRLRELIVELTEMLLDQEEARRREHEAG